jgi:rhamnosyltransferase
LLIFFSVLYNPCKNAIENIKIAMSLGLKPVVYINSVEPHYLKTLQELRVLILGDNSNVGLGVAFFEFEKYFLTTDQEYFIYFDQDTIVSQQAWSDIISTHRELFSRPDVGLIFYGNSVSKYPNFVINSGSLFSKSILISIGAHDQTFFVEGLDYEYCIRVRKNSKKIIATHCPGIDHVSLQDCFTRSVFGYQFAFRSYGLRRLSEFNKVHIRLLKVSLLYGPWPDFLFLFKSFMFFNLKEILSQILLRLK